MIKRIIIIVTIIKIMIIMTPAEKSNLGKCTILRVFYITYVQGFYAFWRTHIQNIHNKDKERFLVPIKIKPISVKPFSTNYDSHFTQQGGAAGPGRQKTKKDSLSIFFRFTIHSTRRSSWPRQTEEVDAAEWCRCVQVHISYYIYIKYDQHQYIS